MQHDADDGKRMPRSDNNQSRVHSIDKEEEDDSGCEGRAYKEWVYRYRLQQASEHQEESTAQVCK